MCVRSGARVLTVGGVLALTWLARRRIALRKPAAHAAGDDGAEGEAPASGRTADSVCHLPPTRLGLEPTAMRKACDAGARARHATPPRRSVQSQTTASATRTGRLCEAAADHCGSFVAVRRFPSELLPPLDTSVGEWLYDKRIVRVMEDASIATVIADMRQELSSCALVYDLTGALLGVLELLDLVRYILSVHAQTPPDAGHEAVRRMLRVCTVAPPAMPLNELCQHLRTGVRYIAIETERGDAQHQIISQRALVEAIRNASAETPTLRAALAQPIPSSLLADERPMQVAPTTWSARRAFETLAAHGITSLPVVDAQGEACGVVSATDALHVVAPQSLDDAVLDVVAASRRAAGIARPIGDVVACARDAPLEHALALMLTERVHHVYVLTPARVPEGVVSFVDILRAL